MGLSVQSPSSLSLLYPPEKHCFSKIATGISALANWKFAGIRSIGWGWTGVIWLYNLVTYLALDPIKFSVRYALSGKSWGMNGGTKDYIYQQKGFWGEAALAAEQRTLHGLQSAETKMFADRNNLRETSVIAEDAKRRAEITRMRELHTLKRKGGFFHQV